MNPAVYSLDPEDYLVPDKPQPIRAPVITQGTDSAGYDTLPEPVRAYLRSPDASQDWSAKAIALKVRMSGIEPTIEWLRVADSNRRKAAYRELGFTVDPTTGEPMD